MASRNPKAMHGMTFSSDEALTELGRAVLEGRPMTPRAVPERTSGEVQAEVELTLSDLLSDDNGEVVFFNDSGVRSLGITTAAEVIADGRAASHVTAAGEDVTGYNFVTFDNGLTLYFQPEVDVIVHRNRANR
jgi:hypothetical protein